MLGLAFQAKLACSRLTLRPVVLSHDFEVAAHHLLCPLKEKKVHPSDVASSSSQLDNPPLDLLQRAVFSRLCFSCSSVVQRTLPGSLLQQDFADYDAASSFLQSQHTDTVIVRLTTRLPPTKELHAIYV